MTTDRNLSTDQDLSSNLNSPNEITRNFVQNHGSPWFGKKLGERIKSAFAEMLYHSAFKVLSHPFPLRLMRAIFSVSRKLDPIWTIGNICIPTRHDDVKEILTRMEDFSCADSMNLKTPAGPFILSIDWRIQHERELQILKKASFPFVDADAVRISRLAKQRANQNIDTALQGAGTSLNIASEYTEDVALHIVENFIGVTALDGSAGRERLRKWLRVLAAQIFTPAPNGSTIQAITAEATSGLICYLHEVLATLERTGTPNEQDTLLQRLVKIVEKEKRNYPWLDDDWICALVAGMITAGNATVARAQTQAIYRLLTLNGAHKFAVDAAQTYTLAPNPKSRSAMLQVVYEALRFNPMLPTLSPRYALRDTRIAIGTDRETDIKAGTNIFPLVFAAMFDPRIFPRPEKFEIGRPIENYLHFGWGPHICFGKFIAEIQFVETSSALFGREGLSVDCIGAGKITYQGPAAVEYTINLTTKPLTPAGVGVAL